MSIKVVIVEDESEIRQMLQILINAYAGFEVTATFASAEEAMPQLVVLKPDVVLMDIHLQGITGIECVAKLKPLLPDAQFIMCTSLETTETIFAALKAGATGYITKTTPPAKLLEAIAEVHQGGSPMSAQIARKVVGSFQTFTPNNDRNKLSKRENEILELLAKGLRYKEIADRLFVSTETVRTHIRHIYEKLQVNNRTEAINRIYKA